MKQDDLCKWLRDNSSGVYRPAAEAAGEIERQASVIAEARAIIKDLCLMYGHPEPAATLERMEPRA